MTPKTKTTLATGAVLAGLITLAIISPRPEEPTPPPQMLTGTSYDPTIKLAWQFSTIRRHPMQDGSKADIPFADVKAGDTARLVMVCGTPERECASGTIKLPAGPLEQFRVVVIMHEVSLVFPISAQLERTTWNRSGAIPTWERVIRAEGVNPLGRAREQVGVRPWEERDAEIIPEDDPKKRRVVRP